jgi:hypothetical protein
MRIVRWVAALVIVVVATLALTSAASAVPRIDKMEVLLYSNNLKA